MINSILLVGVGGQGILLASEILSDVLLKQGFDVKKNEIHGMAQRGGTVTSQIKYGDVVFSPKIAEAEADFIVSFEYMESVRFLNLLKKDGMLISSDQKIIPTTVSSGLGTYPDNIEEYLEKQNIKYSFVNVVDIATKLGNIKTVNTIMMGLLNQYLKFKEEIWIETIKERVKPKFVDLNIKAFQEGMNYRR